MGLQRDPTPQPPPRQSGEGEFVDRETQLYLYQHRMYDASTGRWLNRDPIGLAGGMNLYGYCGSGPVGSVDPRGLILDSMTNFCRRFPAFCAELARDLGGGAGGAGLAAGRQAMMAEGDMAADEAAVVITNAITKCEPVKDWTLQTMARFGQLAHRTLGRFFQSSGYDINKRLRGGGIPDAFKRASDFLEHKPSSYSGISRGLTQVKRYDGQLGGGSGTLIPFPVPWAPEGWPWVHPSFNAGF